MSAWAAFGELVVAAAKIASDAVASGKQSEDEAANELRAAALALRAVDLSHVAHAPADAKLEALRAAEDESKREVKFDVPADPYPGPSEDP